uniref:DUF4773 domain-containing protein n=1 Tax=Timema tahoe TaxID=61484 RepID=A0A7R9IKY0_9NEOP|nr:unnamed protein product [Timema tahoe]
MLRKTSKTLQSSTMALCKNPPAACLPMPVPLIPADFCVRFFNIFTPGRNLHFCTDFEMRVLRAKVIVLHFDCLRMGADGLAMLKPEDNGGLSPSQTTPETATLDPNDDIPYDPVTEIRVKDIAINNGTELHTNNTAENLFNQIGTNNITYISVNTTDTNNVADISVNTTDTNNVADISVSTTDTNNVMEHLIKNIEINNVTDIRINTTDTNNVMEHLIKDIEINNVTDNRINTTDTNNVMEHRIKDIETNNVTEIHVNTTDRLPAIETSDSELPSLVLTSQSTQHLASQGGLPHDNNMEQLTLHYFVCMMIIISCISCSQMSPTTSLKSRVTEGKIFQKRETQEISLSPDQQFRFERLPCSCQTKECGCCAGIKIPRFKFNQRGLNPPRICIPLPQFPLLMFCVRMYDIRFTGNNVQACVNLEARLQDTTLLVISFDCFSVGGDGFGIVKPGTSSALHSLIATDSENPGGGLSTEKVYGASLSPMRAEQTQKQTIGGIKSEQNQWAGRSV